MRSSERMRSDSRLLEFVMLLAVPLTMVAVGSSAAAAEVAYQPTSKNFANPERGLYYQLTSRATERPLRAERLEELRNENITLILRMYYLKQFRDKPLNQVQLDLITRDFATLRQAGFKCILRFAYSSRVGEPDAPLPIVMQHIDQLEPILRENVDLIAVFQTGFIGSWGEMHSSTNGLDKPDSLRAITSRLLKLLPPSRSLSVRTPRLKQICIRSNQPLTLVTAFSSQAAARLGHYNDCFLADKSDVGTYDESNLEAEKQYVEQDTRFVPMGGETCRVSQLTEVDNARRELARMHWTYLHADYHPKVITSWRENKFFSEIQDRLGYRLELVRSDCRTAASAGGSLQVRLELKNTGWAAPINPRDVILIAKHAASGIEYRAKLNVDPRRWLPEQPINITESIGIPEAMPAGKYRFYLLLPDPEPNLTSRPEYAIRLANEGLWDEKSGRHDLSQTFAVNNGAGKTDEPNTVVFEPL